MREGKPVNQYELNGSELRLINTFNSVSEASKETSIPESNIVACLTNNRSSAGGYFWKYNTLKKCPIIEIPKNFPIPIVQIEAYNGLIHCIFPSIQEAARRTNIDAAMISKCLNGEIERTDAWYWKKITDLSYEQQLLPIYQKSPYKLKKYNRNRTSIFEMTDEEFKQFLDEIEKNRWSDK